MNPESAILILETLLDGVDPVTGEVLPPEHVCQEKEVIRALHTAIIALQSADASDPTASSPASFPLAKRGKLNAGRAWTEEDSQRLISLHLENRPLEEICQILQRRPRGVHNQLTYLGLEPHADETAPAKEPISRHGKPWTHAEHEWLKSAWAEGRSASEMADHLGRTPYAIRLRLEQYGLFEGGMTAADEPPVWTDADNRELHRMADEGRSLSEIAARFGRTEKSIEARLFYLGLIKKGLKLF